MKRRSVISFIICTMLSLPATAKDNQITPPNARATQGTTGASPMGFSHKIGALWTQITNYGFYGDRKYAEPNFEWPGGSGNIYGWLTSLWIGAMSSDSLGYVSSGEDNHFTPLESIFVKHADDGSLSAEDTYTRYTDVNPPNPSGVHINLGVEITERTYAWDQSYNDDFIICDYWIKNVKSVQLNGVYAGFRMDADISGFLGTGSDTNLWDKDDLSGYDAANKLVYLYDGDGPTVAGDDTGNPDPSTGVLRSPGYIGARVLYFDSTHFSGSTYTGLPSMTRPSFRNDEPTSAQPRYEYLKNPPAAQPMIPRDYRAMVGIGPFQLPPGDSIHVVIAWVIGYGLKGIVQNSQVAQSMFDGGYLRAPAAPEAPVMTVTTVEANGTNAIALRWQRNAEKSIDPLTLQRDFAGYGVYKTSGQDAGGNAVWDTLGIYLFNDALNPSRDTLWAGRRFFHTTPPSLHVDGTDTTYEYLETGTPNGIISTYAVTAFDKGDTLLGLGRLENQIGRGRASTKSYMANTPATRNVDRIRVVPNPFLGSSRLNNPNPVDINPWVNRLRFINLPPDAKITIFTLSGDLVRTISSGDIAYRSRDAAVDGDFTGIAEWDLVTKNNQEAVSGVYIYAVESKYGTHTGKFVIIR